jgi:hypothetical protein
MNWSEIPGRKGTTGQIISEIIVLSLANNNNEKRDNFFYALKLSRKRSSGEKPNRAF